MKTFVVVLLLALPFAAQSREELDRKDGPIASNFDNSPGTIPQFIAKSSLTRQNGN
jgi:hypothetical protein